MIFSSLKPHVVSWHLSFTAEEKGLHVPGGGDWQQDRSDLLHLLPERGGRGFSQGSEALWGKYLLSPRQSRWSSCDQELTVVPTVDYMNSPITTRFLSDHEINFKAKTQCNSKWGDLLHIVWGSYDLYCIRSGGWSCSCSLRPNQRTEEC